VDRYATHIEALVQTALATACGSILEMGCGDYSTPLLCAFANAQSRELLVQSSDPEWMSKFSLYECDEWGFVFLDSEESTADRIRRLPQLLAVTPLVLLHDSDHAMQRPHWEEMTQGWVIEMRYLQHKPETVLLRRRA
jgi:hypothetical protein